MRICEIILEDRRDYLRSQFEKKLEPLLAHVPDQIKQKLDDLTVNDLFIWIIAQDPSKNFKYATWLLNIVTRGSSRLEDLLHVRELLSKFTANQNSLERKDINQYKSVGDLSSALRGAEQKQQQASQSEEQRARKESKKIYEDNQWLIVIPTTMFAAQYWGKDTEWCTAFGYKGGRHPDRTHNMFEYYDKQGPIYTLFNKENPAENMQIHFESEQFKDADDNDFELSWFVVKYPKLVYPVLDHAFENSKEPSSILELFKYSNVDMTPYEPMFASDPWLASVYANEYLEEPWPKGEAAILQNPISAATYAVETLKERWLEAEPIILKDSDAALLYADRFFVNGWPEAEPVILKNLVNACKYAMYVLYKRWPELEKILIDIPPGNTNGTPLTNKQAWARSYAVNFKWTDYIGKYIRFFE